MCALLLQQGQDSVKLMCCLIRCADLATQIVLMTASAEGVCFLPDPESCSDSVAD